MPIFVRNIQMVAANSNTARVMTTIKMMVPSSIALLFIVGS
ncbi:MAG TPA: hypothetical protein VJA18_04725 [Candidatus Nanoarchaeia archaeon]|nr:hypothetical protein [Candidatus Nanoarchaeia archaeon]